MKLSPVITELRRRCPLFEQRVYGAAEFASIEPSTALKMPCAFVLPLGDTAGEVIFQTDYRQSIEQSIGIAIFVPTGTDETGLIAYDKVEDIKSEVFRAIAGWCPTDDVDELIYEGSSVLDMNRSRLCVQLEFKVAYDIVDDETRHGVDISSLPDLKAVHIDVDFVKPDGRLEASATINLE